MQTETNAKKAKQTIKKILKWITTIGSRDPEKEPWVYLL